MEARATEDREREAPSKLELSCPRCGYGVLRTTPPERCPMCQAENAWIHTPPRASTAGVTSRTSRVSMRPLR